VSNQIDLIGYLARVQRTWDSGSASHLGALTVRKLIGMLAYRHAHAVCRNCNHPIICTDGLDGPWLHLGSYPDCSGYRGCRSASFNGDGWNDTLDRKWQAQPPRDLDWCHGGTAIDAPRPDCSLCQLRDELGDNLSEPDGERAS
jgi:hypothetical protein